MADTELLPTARRIYVAVERVDTSRGWLLVGPVINGVLWALIFVVVLRWFA
jgi:hypothetical protein